MLPPSATLGVADRLTVVTSATGSSVTVVLMVAPLATRCSEVAAADTGDAVGDGAAAGIDVVRRRGGDAAAGGADADGDDFAVGQRDRDQAAGDGVGRGHGVGDQGAFVRCRSP